ncbi:hypothetical protein CsatA_022246 [Cannabis sativa]
MTSTKEKQEQEETSLSSSKVVTRDKYRSFLSEEDNTNTIWRHGVPPTYDDVNLLFQQGRTKEWAKGSLEEIVQNAVKSWEMELSHKIRLQDFKSINPQKFKLFVNESRLIVESHNVLEQIGIGENKPLESLEGLNGEETLRIGSYNALMKNSLPNEFQYYKAEEETFESSHEVFRSAFPRGFAWEVIHVYSGPPIIAFKFRHWGFFEGPYKQHAPTGEMVQFYGIATLKVDEALKVEEVEVYYDPAELIAGFLKGKPISESGDEDSKSKLECPFAKLNVK